MGKAKILVVEDEIIVSADIQATLKNLGYDIVGSASTGEDAVRIVSKNEPDLILMDIMLQGDVDGVEAADQIKDLYNIPVVFLTAYSDDKTLARAKISEPFGYVVKPFDERELHTNIEIALHKHRIENELRESRQWFSTILTSIGDAIIAVDGNGDISYMNPVAEYMSGWTDGLGMGMPFEEVAEIIDEGDGQAITHTGESLLDYDRVKEMGNGLLLVAKNGAKRPVIGTVAPIFDENGEKTGSVFILKDITEKRLAEKALRSSERFNKDIVEHSPLGIIYIDINCKVIYVNRALTNLINIKYSEVANILGRPLQSIIKTEGAGFGKKIKELLNGKSISLDNIESRSRVGKSLLLNIYGAPRVDSEGEVMGGVIMILDTTEYAELENQLQHAQKMRAIGALAGGIAHDFNNILTLVKGNAELGILKSSEEEPLRKYFERIQSSAIRGTDLTKQLLLFGRSQMNYTKSLNLNIVVADTISILERTIDPKIEIKFNRKKQLWMIDADEGKMSQIIMNLCINAAQAMEEGGNLTITTANTEINQDYCKTNAEAFPGKFVQVSVEDTGCGISKENLNKIFEPFFSTKEGGKGSGLGLSVVYGIVNGHKGWITVSSKISKGTKFSIFLPRAENITDQIEEVEEEEPRGGNETILLVDDEAEARNLGRNILENYGYRLLLAKDGEEAVVVYRREKKNIDLVILDLMMPRKSGKDAFMEILKINPEVKVIIYSGFDKVLQVQEMLKKGAKKFIQKPYQIRQLLRDVRAVLDMK